MRNPQAVRALTSLWVFTIVEGFYHASEFGASTLASWLCWLQIVAASAGGWVLSRKAPVRGAVLAFSVAVTGMTCGTAAGAQHVHLLNGILGKQVAAVATVQSVYPNRRTDTVVLAVSRIRENGHTTSCEALAVYYQSHHARPLDKGMQLQLAGVFMERNPPPTSRQGTQIHSVTSSVRYEFQGRVTSQTPPAADRWLVWRNAVLSPLCRVQGMTVSDVQLAASLMFGGTALPASDKQVFLASGLLHVLAASGANVMILETVLQWTVFPVWRRCRLPYTVWLVTLLACIWVYSGLCSWQPSIQRAAILATYRLLATAFGRQARTADGLLWTLCVMAAFEPATVTGVSAALSFLATGAVERAIHTSASARWRNKGWAGRMAHSMVRVIRATVFVELFVFPVSVGVFGQWTPYAIFSNLFAEPLLGCLLPLCLLLTGLAWMGHWFVSVGIVANLVGEITHIGLGLFLGLVKTVAMWPGALLSIPPLPNVLWLGYYGFIFYVFYLRDRNRTGRALNCQRNRLSENSL